MPLLSVKDLKMYFPVRSGFFSVRPAQCKSVDGVSFSLEKGETLGLVGESGCGKTTLGKVIAGLYAPTAGTVTLDGVEVSALSRRQRFPWRRHLQMIFQDPAESLNQRHTIGEILEEPFIIHRIGKRPERRRHVEELLTKVGLDPSAASRYPFEFSGGQRQRIGIARAIALKPNLVICDEPVSALDVSIQGQVLNLLMELQREMHLACLFIAHDLAVVKHVSDRVAIMYLGKIVELGPAAEVFRNPLHAYTKALISAIPRHNPSERTQRILIPGDVPSPINPPAGCAFGHRTRHPLYPESISTPPTFREALPNHWVLSCPCCCQPDARQ
ncbi:MAG: ATP-binding cassette domain-containing protein [Puniceicoccales bacterium]|jgi:oligopeptide/dipeptide ABC transporter ATP-binding protein|nr:ATP-binding cassette domain-containing protein [Puniceicoccales bacterium]